jgi:PAS domain S-box-containing protein
MVMDDHRKTKKQLIAELVQSRERVAQLEHAEAKHKQLEEGRAIAARVLTSSPDLICVAGMDGYFKYLNPAWEKSLGYTQAELLSRPFLDFIHPDDHAQNDAEIEKLAKGHPTVNFENRYKHKNGSILTISWTATPLPEEKVMYCIGRDITQRKQVEDKWNVSIKLRPPGSGFKEQ